MLAVVLLTVTPAGAEGPPDMHGPGGGMMGGPPPGGPAFLRQLFPPNLVMEHQQEIGLRSAQVDTIKKAMNEAQQRLLDLQWRLEAESEGLTTLLAAPRVDEKATLQKLDVVTGIEQQVKKTNFTLLIEIKNALDPDQQAKLRALQPARGFGPPGGSPPGGPPPGGS